MHQASSPQNSSLKLFILFDTSIIKSVLVTWHYLYDEFCLMDSKSLRTEILKYKRKKEFII